MFAIKTIIVYNNYVKFDEIIIHSSIVFKHMFLIIIFKGYPRMTSKYFVRISLFNLTHMMSVANHVIIEMETPKIDNGSFLEKEFTQLIYMNL